MTDYSNWKVLKSVINYSGDDEEKQTQAQAAQEQYAEVAEWCNENGQYTIEEDELYYKTVGMIIPVPTVDELKAQVRAVRDIYLQEYDFTQLPDAPFTEEEKAEYAAYRQYLRDYTTLNNWWEQNPLTFNEWQENN